MLRRWVEAGAEYQPHWAYVTPRRPEVPTAKQAGWVRDPIDAFILGTLEAKGIARFARGRPPHPVAAFEPRPHRTPPDPRGGPGLRG